eukprot:maker-scaffold344_size201325-snap-gene-1.20 protein:Tk02535 transcript:maker-scaffold344_size201325-snap-gene-1.20-mRNA-1 annotation:"vesicle transport through interaction with t-snares homolog 1b"
MAKASSEKFELIQDDLDTNLEGIQSALAVLAKKSASSKAGAKEEARHWSMRTRSSLVEARQLIADMEAEARLAPIQYRGDMLARVRQYREDTAQWQAQLCSYEALSQAESLLGPRGNSRGQREAVSEWPPPSDQERYRRQVVEGTNSLDRSSRSVLRSQQVAVETEAVSTEIIGDLSIQREQLERTRERIYETNDELSRSRRILKRIYFGVIQNKAILIGIILIEILILCGLVYLKLLS